MINKYLPKVSFRSALVLLLTIVLLYVVQLQNYLLFHSLAEFFSIIIGFCIFIIAWNGKKYIQHSFLLIIGVSYLFISFLDILHTLGYAGMGVFTDYGFYGNQLWIAARALEAGSLLAAILLIRRKLGISINSVFLFYSLITSFLVYSIFFSDIFPVCYIEGKGQTQFKLASEYIIIAVLVTAFYLNFKKKKELKHDIFIYLSWALIFTILSELAFTFYISNYGFSNMLGHYSKIMSFYFLYKALVEKSITEPFDLIFDELSRRKQELEESNQLKLKLFSIISHDLRNPFISIVSFINVLSMNERLKDDPLLAPMISQLKDSSTSTLMLLDNLLSWSRLEMGGHKLKKELHTVLSIAEESAESLKPLYKKKGIELEFDIHESSAIRVDWNTINIVFRNILSNALKFSYPGGKVQVRSFSKGNKVIIEFTDNGTGMVVPENLFSSGTSFTAKGTNNEKGSGLGLNLIRQYTVENGGFLSIESSPGNGTTVSLSFDNPANSPVLETQAD